MKTVAIIQARMSSTRLPGKVLMDLCGQTVLERVVRRIQCCRYVDEIIVATSTLPANDEIEAKCRQMHVPVFRGSESDVLDRFFKAAIAHNADICVRVTADNPLIDPALSDEIIRQFKQANPPVDYASNKIPPSYPQGLDTEVFTIDALKRTWQHASLPYEREHVTIFIYEHPDQFRLLNIMSDVGRADWRWTLDALEDLEFIRQIYARLGPTNGFTWQQVVDLLKKEPALCTINQHVLQKPIRE
ncbi:MAG: glycosyltransferase family protein [Candidatus Aminicenantes bacterium]|nr:glycosyltransferase family protein [Candidatus Aminicenantes bacterium]